MTAAALVGRTVARYRIVELLGSGGMGEVFKAIDSVLQRPVALKILPPELLHDEMRLRRFVLEAQTASALNHPNIVTIYDVGSAPVESSEGTAQTVHYIAMELIIGETLRTLIYQRPVPLRTILGLMHGVADAVSKAHSAAILHRDLKPDNIMVTTDGRAKVVDFGLAKLLPGNFDDGPDAATMQLERTREGVVVGTVGYMSPEQISGGAIDGRSDIFSFGCVLYEAICRVRPFVGDNVIDTLHKIQSSPHQPVTTVDPALPPALERITNRCLAKDLEERYQSMKEVEVELRLLLRDYQSGGVTAIHSGALPEPVEVKPSGRRRRWVILSAILGTMIIAAALIARLTPVQQIDLSSYRFTPLETMPEYEGSPAFSPDGRSIAYIAEVKGVLQVFTRSLDAMKGAQLSHSLEDCSMPFWTPDGSAVEYISIAGEHNALWSIGVGGGSARVVLEDVETASISPDGRTLAFIRQVDEGGVSQLGLWLASPPSAPAKRFLGEGFARSKRPFIEAEDPQRTGHSSTLRFSPDASKLGVWLVSGEAREFWIIDMKRLTASQALLSLSDVPRPNPFSWMPDNRSIVFSGAHGANETPGQHLWVADTVSDHARAITSSPGSESWPTVSPDGKKIVFGSEEFDFDIMSLSIKGEHLQSVLSTAREERGADWAPSGNGFAYVTNRSGSDEIWFRSSQGDFERPIATNKDFNDGSPSQLIAGLCFSPDGQRIAYHRQGKENRAWISPVGGGPALPLNVAVLSRSGKGEYSPTWSPDSSAIAFIDGASGFGLSKIRLGTDSQPVPILGNTTYPLTRWSPSGQWVTASTKDGFLIVSPDGSVKKKISDARWLVHEWAKDSRSIYGVRMNDDLHLLLCRLSIDGSEQVIADLGISPAVTIPIDGFSLSPDGQTFLLGLVKPKGDIWMLEGFDVQQQPWWRRWFPAH